MNAGPEAVQSSVPYPGDFLLSQGRETMKLYQPRLSLASATSRRTCVSFFFQQG
jgi:hypothetical protein